VSFEVDADGLLSVAAVEQSSGVRASVEVKPSYGLSDGEIETMLRDSLTHADVDLDARRLREQQVEAQRVIEVLRAALAADGDQLLTRDEREPIEQHLQLLVEIAGGDDAAAIQAATERLEAACAFYVERRMNAGMRQAMAGHKVDEFE
jgi:molecular chaperone HscA